MVDLANGIRKFSGVLEALPEIPPCPESPKRWVRLLRAGPPDLTYHRMNVDYEGRSYRMTLLCDRGVAEEDRGKLVCFHTDSAGVAYFCARESGNVYAFKPPDNLLQLLITRTRMEGSSIYYEQAWPATGYCASIHGLEDYAGEDLPENALRDLWRFVRLTNLSPVHAGGRKRNRGKLWGNVDDFKAEMRRVIRGFRRVGIQPTEEQVLDWLSEHKQWPDPDTEPMSQRGLQRWRRDAGFSDWDALVTWALRS